MKFKKGEWDKAKDVLFFDLNNLFDTGLAEIKDKKMRKQFNNTFKLLKGNLEDLYGVKK